MEDFRIPVLEAMRRLYTSETFSKLNNIETGLYLESPAYIYDIYKSENVTKNEKKNKNDFGIKNDDKYCVEKYCM